MHLLKAYAQSTMTDVDRFTLRHVTENRQEMKKINKKKIFLTV